MIRILWSNIFGPRTLTYQRRHYSGSICPFCALLGYLTPSLIDEYAAGDPAVAGKPYAINVLGCILGPLVGCYVLLPLASERHALILSGIPFIAFWLLLFRSQSRFQRVSFGIISGRLWCGPCF